MQKIAVLFLAMAMVIGYNNLLIAKPPLVGEFKFNEISGSGCGMTLWNPSRSNKNQFLFFNGLNNTSMEMKINGKITKFNRVKASGQKFYGQQTFQSFRERNGKIIVDVAVKLGAKGEIETVAIKQGTLVVKQNGQEVKLPVVGDAGC
ncbi:hypothetical protein NUACC21_61640 [Scytonema sp. NUACC21]